MTDDPLVHKVATDILWSLELWQRGCAVSPCESDWIHYADQALRQVNPQYGSTVEGRNFLADELHDKMVDDVFDSGRVDNQWAYDCALWIIQRLEAE